MSVRVAGVEDLPMILALDRDAEGPHWTAEQYLEALTQDGAVTRRVFAWGGGLGFSVGMVMRAGGIAEGELEHVVVAAAARRQGIGRALCEAVVDWARDLGCEDVRLEVRVSNVGATLLYERLGFRETGRRRGYYRSPVEDAALMDLNFGPM